MHSEHKYDEGEIKRKTHVEFLSIFNLAKQQRGQKLEVETEFETNMQTNVDDDAPVEVWK